MRLPASITAQPPDATESLHLAVTHVDPIDVSDVEQTAAQRKPWWARASIAIAGGVFTTAAAALIAVTGATYVGLYHAPWVRSLAASHTPTATQAGDAVSVANAAPPATAAAEAITEPASPDQVAAARDRMEQRVYSQVQQPGARTVAARETLEDSDAPTSSNARRHHRGTRYMRHSAAHYNAPWYKGA